MRVSVIVPVYNEEETIVQILETLSQVPLDLEVIIVDDGSTDRSWNILQQLRQKEPFDTYHYIQHSYNQGKGACLGTGFRLISGDLVVVQDADMEYDPRDLPTLVHMWEEARDTRATVYGVRDLSMQKFTTRWGNRFMTRLVNILYGCNIHDLHTCYKVIPANLARVLPMKSRRFAIDPEITACVIRAGYTILEAPISYAPRTAKKLSPWKDGWPALATLLHCRFGKRYQIAAFFTNNGSVGEWRTEHNLASSYVANAVHTTSQAAFCTDPAQRYFVADSLSTKGLKAQTHHQHHFPVESMTEEV